MQRQWDDRARHDAFHYICSDRKEWDRASFFDSGETDYQSLVAPVLDKMSFVPRGKSMLELGCGVGRMTRSFSRRFERVYAVDISEEMLRRARAFCADTQNIVWVHGNGSAIPQLGDGVVDFVFSYLVLQHVPAKQLALGYIREMLRVLKPRGVYCFQFNNCLKATMNRKGRLVWSLLDRMQEPLFGIRLDGTGRRLASLLSLDPRACGRTWRGPALSSSEVLETICSSGASVEGVMGWDTALAWCYGRAGGSRENSNSHDTLGDAS